MGKQADEALAISYDAIPEYLHANHSVFMQVGAMTYYLTDVNDRYWRAQDTNTLNEKGHFVDVSELVPTVSEFIELPFVEGKTIQHVFDQATFFASVK
ncbi:MAG: CDP-alcohol phosphatidyltransferase [Raoultibacter sp.]